MCQFRFRILASEYFVRTIDSFKRVVSTCEAQIVPAWPERAWAHEMLDLLNKRAARRELQHAWCSLGWAHGPR